MESKHVDVLQKLLRDPVVQQCRLRRDGDDDLLASALPSQSAPPTLAAKPGAASHIILLTYPQTLVSHMTLIIMTYLRYFSNYVNLY